MQNTKIVSVAQYFVRHVWQHCKVDQLHDCLWSGVPLVWNGHNPKHVFPHTPTSMDKVCAIKKLTQKKKLIDNLLHSLEDVQRVAIQGAKFSGGSDAT